MRSCVASTPQDSALDTFDAAIGLWPPGMNEAMPDAQLGGRLPEGAGAELETVIGGDALELPASCNQLAVDTP
ncbi:MAG: hypothetical protein R3C29_06155 [Dehalococcoidia bacterium]